LPTESAAEIGERKPIKVTFDKLEELPEKLGVKLRLPIARGGAFVELEFTSLDDFHPDQVYKQIDLFDDLSELKGKLERSSTVEEASEKLRGWAEAHAAEEPPPEVGLPSSRSASIPVAGSLADIAARAGQGPAEEGETLGTQALLARIVGPYLPADGDSEEWVAAVEKATTGLMRDVLHHPDYQALESAWRALDQLTRVAHKSAVIDIVAYDITAEEFAADLAAADDLGASGLHALLVEKSAHAPDGDPWAAIVGHYQFQHNAPQIEVLGRMAKIAQLLAAPFLTSVYSDLLLPAFQPDPDAEDAWTALRLLPEAGFVGMSLPSYLLRPPFGEAYKPAEQFSFEEFGGPGQEGYLWGNAAVASAMLLMKSFIADGWGFKPGKILALDSVPMHIYRMPDDDTDIAVTTELRFTNTTSQKVTKRGLMPWLAVRGRDSIELVGVQSIAEPTRNLAGKWEQAAKPAAAGEAGSGGEGGEGSGEPVSDGYAEVKPGEEEDFWRPNEPEPEPDYSSEETPSEDPPADEFSFDTPSEEPPAEDPPAEEFSFDTPSEETPAEETPTDYTLDTSLDAPADETPVEETPAEEPPAEEAPVEEPPAEEPPAEEPVAEETPAEEPPAEETPAVEDEPITESEPMASVAEDLDTQIAQAQAKAPWSEKCSPPILDFKSLLEPIPGDNPAGESLPYDIRENLEEFRKEINPDAFAANDPMRPEDFKPAEWTKIESLAQEALIEKTKDLMVAARLTEALTKIHHFAGLRDGLCLMRLMVECCWDRLSPEIEDEEDLDVRSGPFNWLDDTKRGALFPMTVQMTPLVKDGEGAYSWYQWTQSKSGKGDVSGEQFDRAVRNASREDCERRFEDIRQCIAEVNALDDLLGQKLRGAAPSFGAIKMAINDAYVLAKQIFDSKPAPVADSGDAAGEEGGGAEAGTGGGGGGGMMVRRAVTRDDLYKQLAEVAAKLQQIEPHSPIPYLINRAVELGKLPFPLLLKTLVQDDSIISQLSREFGLKSEEEAQ